MVIRDYPWVENGLFVTYVRDADPTSVIEAMTVRSLGTANGLRGVNERGWEEISMVGAASWADGRPRLYLQPSRACPKN